MAIRQLLTRSTRRKAAAGVGAGLAAVLVTSLIIVNSGSSAGPGAQTPGSQPGTAGPHTTDATPVSPGGQVPEIKAPQNFPAGFRLEAGTRPAGAAPAEQPGLVAGTPLPPTTFEQILSRLPELGGDVGLGTSFRWPTRSIAKPGAGTVIDQKFPAAGDGRTPPEAPKPPAGPLTVLRMQPQGDVSIAPFISITFSQPMVPVGTVGQVNAADAPAQISPTIKGHWEWIGTSTARFVADSDLVDRLPMATTFTVTVPAGTKSTTGGALAAAATATFRTPPPKVATFTPDDKLPTATNPIIVTTFDQRVDPAAVLKSTTVTVDGERWPMRIATAAEIAADTNASAAVSAATDGRLVAITPQRPFPGGAAVQVSIDKGTPSAEGPLTSAEDSVHRFTVRSAMTVRSASCDGYCGPGASIVVELSNPIDTDAFDPTQVAVEPAVPGGAVITAAFNRIRISGATEASTTYRITVRAGLKDVFGQTLQADHTSTAVVGKAAKSLSRFSTMVTTLDPMASSAGVTVTTVNHRSFRIRVFAVTLADWGTYRSWYTARTERDLENLDEHLPPWKVLLDKKISPAESPDRAISTHVDLSSLVGSERTQAVILVQPLDRLTEEERWANQPSATWAQLTPFTVDAFADATTLSAWVTDLRSGQPVPKATVGFLAENGTTGDEARATDASGLAGFELTSSGVGALLVTAEGRTTILPADMWGSGWTRNVQHDRLLWYVTDDRGTYRPGEKMSVKGWVRRQSADTAMTLTAPPSGTISWTATDGTGATLASGTAELGRTGGFDFVAELPAGANLGQASLQLKLNSAAGIDSTEFGHSFLVADFRTPAFEVTTHPAVVDPAIRGAALTVQADATYYAGGALGDAPVEWQVRTSTASYSPPGWGNFTFGIWRPWWFDMMRGSPERPYPNCCGQSDDSIVQTFTGRTDGAGSDYLDVNVGDLGKEKAGLPITVTAQATVTDVNRQQIAGTADVIVHPGRYYVGLASDKTFVKQGEPLSLQAIVAGIDGKAVAGKKIVVSASKVNSTWAGTEYTDTLAETVTCEVTSAATPVTCTFEPKSGGSYRIIAIVTDEDGRSARTQLDRWVAGPNSAVSTSVQQQELTLIPDRQTYQPDEQATVLVQSPIVSGTGLIVLNHNGIVERRTFEVKDSSAVITVPITEALIPGVNVVVEVVGTAPRSATEAGAGVRPAYAAGQLDLDVSTASRELTVTTTPRDATVKPGAKTAIDVTVTDAAGKPVSGSEFEIIVVDEAVLSLSDYELDNPLETFYPRGDSWLNTVFGRSTVMLGQLTKPGSGETSSAAAASSAAGTAAPAPATDQSYDTSSESAPTATGGTKQRDGSAPIAQRSKFDALALFRPSVMTDAAGKAVVEVTMPDNLTRYRVMVVAVAGDNQFGMGDATVAAGLPLTVRPTAPRFLNFGDTAELPVLVQNRTNAPITANVVLQGANLTVRDAGTGKTAGATGRQVTVPANSRIEVRFAVAAAKAGTARFRVVAVSGDDADAAVVELPVFTPATTESFATYGSVPGGKTVSQQITKPANVIGEYGSLQVSTSSTALAQLTDAITYLTDYPYDSSDALAARVLAIASLADVLKAFDVPGVSAQKLAAQVNTDVAALIAMQREDGGYPYWSGGYKSQPFNTIQVTQALLVARKHGFGTGRADTAVQNAQKYLQAIDSHLDREISQQTRDSINAYALSVRGLSGAAVGAEADAMFQRRGSDLPMDAVAWLLPIVGQSPRDALLVRVNNATVDDAGAVSFTESVADDAWTILHSSRRTDGLMLDALLTVAPKSDVVEKVVKGLINARRGGRWTNVQENSVILLGLRHYYDTFESAGADFVARVWLGDRFAGEHAYSGHSTDQTQLDIPTAELLKQGNTSVTLDADGKGRMYYRIGLTTAPSDLTVDPLDRGFVVTRTYAGADNPADVTRDANGVWQVKAGARVRVTLNLVSRSARSHVALIDPLPAGFEALNPDLAISRVDMTPQEEPATTPVSEPGWYGWYGWTWYDHQNLRDDRAEATATWLQGGDYSYSYVAVATTPGTFVAPATRAEQIYAPETFGRSGTDRVVVK